YGACHAHWLAQAPPPDPRRHAAIADPDDRLEAVLRDLYAWYRQGQDMIRNVSRDADMLPALAETPAPQREAPMQAGPPAPRRRPPGRRGPRRGRGGGGARAARGVPPPPLGGAPRGGGPRRGGAAVAGGGVGGGGAKKGGGRPPPPPRPTLMERGWARFSPPPP